MDSTHTPQMGTVDGQKDNTCLGSWIVNKEEIRWKNIPNKTKKV